MRLVRLRTVVPFALQTRTFILKPWHHTSTRISIHTSKYVFFCRHPFKAKIYEYLKYRYQKVHLREYMHYCTVKVTAKVRGFLQR